MKFSRILLLPVFFIATSAVANEYPTIESVRHVVTCMAENGGQTEETLYACACRFDVIKSAFTFEEYESVSVYVRNRAMPGEKGAVFRDLGRATRDLRTRFELAEKEAERKCPVARRVVRSVR